MCETMEQRESDAYLMRTAMKHAYMLVGDDMNCPIFNVAQFNEIRFECKNPGIAQSKVLGCTFPVNSPFWSSSPTVPVYKKRELRVVEQKFAVQSFYVDGFCTFLASDKVE